MFSTGSFRHQLIVWKGEAMVLGIKELKEYTHHLSSKREVTKLRSRPCLLVNEEVSDTLNTSSLSWEGCDTMGELTWSFVFVFANVAV